MGWVRCSRVPEPGAKARGREDGPDSSAPTEDSRTQHSAPLKRDSFVPGMSQTLYRTRFPGGETEAERESDGTRITQPEATLNLMGLIRVWFLLPSTASVIPPSLQGLGSVFQTGKQRLREGGQPVQGHTASCFDDLHPPGLTLCQAGLWPASGHALQRPSRLCCISPSSPSLPEQPRLQRPQQLNAGCPGAQTSLQ